MEHKFEKESINKNIVTRKKAQLLGKRTKAQRQTAQKNRWAHGASKITTEDRLEQMQVGESPTARMPSLEGTSMGHYYRNAPAWNTHDKEMVVRMPPSGRTSASQRISGQTSHLKSQQRNTAKRHWPDCTHDTISPEPSTPMKG